jgi:hypothetical protein
MDNRLTSSGLLAAGYGSESYFYMYYDFVIQFLNFLHKMPIIGRITKTESGLGVT